MGLIEWIRGLRPGSRAGDGGDSPTLRPLSFTAMDYKLASNETVFGAISILASTFAAQPMQLYHGCEVDTADKLNRLLCYRPCSGMTPYVWKRTMEVCRHATGNSYALIVPDEDWGPKSLDILNPAYVEPLRAVETGDIWYRYKHPDAPVIYLPERMVIHGSHISTDGDKGINPLRVLSPSLAYSDRMREFSLRQAKGIGGSVVLEVPGNPGDARAKEIAQHFEEAYRRSDGGLLVLGGGAKASTIKREAAEGKMLDVDRMTVNRAARVFAMPPTLLGDYSQSSYSSQEQQSLDYIQRSIVTTNAMYEDELAAKLLTYKQIMDGWRIRFDKSVLQVADAATQAEVDQKHIRGGVATLNEIRAKYGRAPVQGGEKTFISGDLHPLEEGGNLNGK